MKTQQQQQQQNATNELLQDSKTHLPTALGLKIRNLQKQKQQQQQQLQQQCSNNSNSLLKQQLRAGLKEIVENNKAMKAQKTQPQQQQQQNSLDSTSNNELACSALQSLANVAAERQPPTSVTLQPPSASDLQQQFLLHMAANPMLKSSTEFFQRQQQHQQKMLEQQQQQQQQEQDELEFINEQNDKSEPELMLIDESLGLEYKSPEHNENGNESIGNAPTNEQSNNGSNDVKPTSRSVQRRRVRRKAQSSVDDQAEHLTEMSVRGLDLFRYACINEGVYQCTECAKENVQKTFKNKYSFQRHAFLYHEGQHRKVFPCPLCGKEFSRPDKMKNHMKMTHESFVANKEVTNFNPLNYLITAAAAGEMHATLFTQQQQQQQQQNTDQLEQLTAQQQQYNNAMAALSVSLEASNMQTNALSVSLELSTNTQTKLDTSNTQIEQTEQQPTDATTTTTTAMDISAAALLKLQNDIFIKREVEHSPSPSPPPALQTTQTLPTRSTVMLPLSTLSSQLSLTKSSTSPVQNIAINLPQTQQTANTTNATRVEEVK